MFGSPESGEKVTPEQVNLETDQGILDSEGRKWGLPLKDVYKYGLSFYKDKDGKAVHLTYEDRLKLVAYTQQAAHGPLVSSEAAPLGVLDVIGRDRRAAWAALGDISHVQAIAGFVHTLDRLCPQFKPYITAIQKDLEDKKEQQTKQAEREQAHQELEVRVSLENQRQPDVLTEEQQVQKVKDALNAQTYSQFVQYAQQQHPENVEEQGVLIRQLQERHYQQYIQQLAVDQRLANLRIADDNHNAKTDMLDNTKAMQTPERSEEVIDNEQEQPDHEEEEEDTDDDGFPELDEARMWTRAEIVPFKESARASGGRLTVGHGETVTVRVPTHEHARSLCWEFATDHYDIGFGLYFEWSKPSTNEVTVVITESDDDDDDDDDDDELEADAETGPNGESAALATVRPPLSIVVPIYRRDCYTEVYAGTHTYPGEGVYLLKFDNTYSLWRSKTLYYKVYYTQ